MSFLLQQSHLGPNSNKALTLVDAAILRAEAISSNPRRWTPTGEAFIFRLSNELLASIVDYATSKNGTQCSCSKQELARDKTIVKGLNLVCQRIKTIAQPILYRRIKFEWPDSMAPPSRVVIKLWRTLSQNASLRQNVRFLSMHIPDVPETHNPEKYDVLKCFASWLTRVRCLHIHGGFDGSFHHEHTWNLIDRFSKNMKEIKHISLGREGWGLHLEHIIPHLARFSNLRKLDVHGITSFKTIEKLDLEGKSRTSPIRELSLSDYEEGRIGTKQLLAWPKALTHFHFGSFYNNKHTMDYTDFESWLSIHSATLKSVDIGYLSSGGSSRLFNATLFPNLESLKLSRWQQGRSWHLDQPLPFTADDANVLGPKVKFFGWDFGIYDQHSESWDAFGANEEAWLTCLVETAAVQKAALKKIKIYFTPDPFETKEEDGYPWDRMDRVRDGACRKYNIELEYNDPPMVKWQWLDSVNPEVQRENERLMGMYDEHITHLEEQARRESAVEESNVEDETEIEIERPGYHGRDIREFFSLVQVPDA
ncbi:hypothetical protein K505DRAFT_324955 [Melanomma pulvis-pyrius CBS 109.77]|uniref:Uncharacterized protein n=1 Tax=Melanomma pulvis-pyrius CBS 109.77 TaxID=1314802 RepID=A0A6A6XDM7_9PLEO|nr:hypothetical protein K505DRAFT_324955 [Melanomma pulvis-pyrius CBS 109.77]